MWPIKLNYAVVFLNNKAQLLTHTFPFISTFNYPQSSSLYLLDYVIFYCKYRITWHYIQTVDFTKNWNLEPNSRHIPPLLVTLHMATGDTGTALCVVCICLSYACLTLYLWLGFSYIDSFNMRQFCWFVDDIEMFVFVVFLSAGIKKGLMWGCDCCMCLFICS